MASDSKKKPESGTASGSIELDWESAGESPEEKPEIKTISGAPPSPEAAAKAKRANQTWRDEQVDIDEDAKKRAMQSQAQAREKRSEEYLQTLKQDEEEKRKRRALLKEGKDLLVDIPPPPKEAMALKILVAIPLVISIYGLVDLLLISPFSGGKPLLFLVQDVPVVFRPFFAIFFFYLHFAFEALSRATKGVPGQLL